MVPNALMTLVTVLGLSLVLLIVAKVDGVSVAVLSSGLLCPGVLTVFSRTGIVLLSSSCPGLPTSVSRIETGLLTSSCPGLLTVVSRAGVATNNVPLRKVSPRTLFVITIHDKYHPSANSVPTTNGDR